MKARTAKYFMRKNAQCPNITERCISPMHKFLVTMSPTPGMMDEYKDSWSLSREKYKVHEQQMKAYRESMKPYYESIYNKFTTDGIGSLADHA